MYTAPVRDGVGGVTGRIFVARDKTAEHEAERLKSELVATVSHELRTPLASIVGFAELLVDRDVDKETRERYVTTIHGEAMRLTTLINDFLDLQRIEEGDFTLALEPFELTELLREQVDLFSGQSGAHEVELSESNGELNLLGERDRVAQVIAQPGLECDQVLARRRGGLGRRRDAGTEPSESGSAIPASGFPPTSSECCSRSSIGSTRPILARSAAQVSASRFVARSSRPTAAGSGSTASRARAPPSGSSCLHPSNAMDTARGACS